MEFIRPSGDSGIFNQHKERYRFALRFIEGKRVLDIACGSGYGTSILGEKARFVVGADRNRSALIYASSYKKRNISFVRCDARYLPFKKGVFDRIVSYETIEHIPQYGRFIHQIKNTMAEESLLLISTPNRILRFKKPKKDYHYHEFYPEEFHRLLLNNFEQVEIRGQDYISRKKYVRLLFFMLKDWLLHSLKAKPRLHIGSGSVDTNITTKGDLNSYAYLIGLAERKKRLSGKRRILLLTALERSFYSSIIENYLFSPALEVETEHPEIKFYYLGLIPIPMFTRRDRLFRGFTQYRERRKRLKVRFSAINPLFLPFPFPSKFYLSPFWVLLFLLRALPIVLFFIFLWNIHLIHARSYPAALIAWTLKRFLGIEYIFDMRGLYPEHGYEGGFFNRSSYRFWKRREKRLFLDAKRVITVSEPMDEIVREKNGTSVLIPLFVDTEVFHPQESIKSLHGLDNRFVILHSGAFGTWGDHLLIGRVLSLMKGIDPSLFLVILTGRDDYRTLIEKDLEKSGLTEFLILSSEPEEVSRMLPVGDVGLLCERSFLTQKVCLSVKFGEYLASGMPVICTPWVSGARRLIERYNCGIVIDPDKRLESLEGIRYLFDNYNRLRQNALTLARSYLAKKNWLSSYYRLWR